MESVKLLGILMRNDETCVLFWRYFDDDDEEQNINDLEYMPAPGSPVLNQTDKHDSDSDNSEDPLDAFMADIEVRFTH
jgi:hypothetical protein